MLSYLKEKFNVKSKHRKVVGFVKNPKQRFRFSGSLSNGDPASPSASAGNGSPERREKPMRPFFFLVIREFNFRKSHPLTRRAKEKIKAAAAIFLEGVAAMHPIDQVGRGSRSYQSKSPSQRQQAVDLPKGEKPMRPPNGGALKIADVAADMPPIDQNSAEDSYVISIPPLQQISTGNVSRGKINIGRMFVASNCLIEITSAVFEQISSKHKPVYALVVMLLSFMSTLLIIIELAYKAGKIRVVWRFPWFYHQSPRNKRFGTFPEIVGLVCAILQSIVSAIIYGMYLHHADYPLKISFWPIIFSFGLLCSKFMENKDHNNIPSVTPHPKDS